MLCTPEITCVTRFRRFVAFFFSLLLQKRSSGGGTGTGKEKKSRRRDRSSDDKKQSKKKSSKKSSKKSGGGSSSSSVKKKKDGKNRDKKSAAGGSGNIKMMGAVDQDAYGKNGVLREADYFSKQREFEVGQGGNGESELVFCNIFNFSRGLKTGCPSEIAVA